MDSKRIKICRRGKSCGFTCISQKKVCRKELPAHLASPLNAKAAELSKPNGSALSTFVKTGRDLSKKLFKKGQIDKVLKMKKDLEKKENDYINFSILRNKIYNASDWKAEAKKNGLDTDGFDSRDAFDGELLKRKSKLGDKVNNLSVKISKAETELYDSFFSTVASANSDKSFDDFFSTKLPSGVDGVVLDSDPFKFLPAISAFDVKESLTDVSKLINKGIGDKIVVGTADPRAWAVKQVSGYPLINVGWAPKRSTLFHEYGHHIEYNNSDINKAAQEWLQARSSGKKAFLKDITKGNYEDDEEAWVGNFFDPYIGKIYDNGTTEVVSMGLEHFSSGKSMMSLYEKDSELFYFMLGIMNG
jgi:hypothetical protein